MLVGHAALCPTCKIIPTPPLIIATYIGKFILSLYYLKTINIRSAKHMIACRAGTNPPPLGTKGTVLFK